jgi:hypothetical protein
LGCLLRSFHWLGVVNLICKKEKWKGDGSAAKHTVL